MLRITFDSTRLKEKISRLQSELKKQVLDAGKKEAAEIVIEKAKKLFDERYDTNTGAAKDAIVVVAETTYTISVGLDDDIAPYAKWLHDGTDDHWVEPTNAQALHWSNGKDYFSKGHMVSGIKEYKFIDKAIKQSQSAVNKCFQRHFDEAVHNSGADR
jgi:hypothetical protein